MLAFSPLESPKRFRNGFVSPGIDIRFKNEISHLSTHRGPAHGHCDTSSPRTPFDLRADQRVWTRQLHIHRCPTSHNLEMRKFELLLVHQSRTECVLLSNRSCMRPAPPIPTAIQTTRHGLTEYGRIPGTIRKRAAVMVSVAQLDMIVSMDRRKKRATACCCELMQNIRKGSILTIRSGVSMTVSDLRLHTPRSR